MLGCVPRLGIAQRGDKLISLPQRASGITLRTDETQPLEHPSPRNMLLPLRPEKEGPLCSSSPWGPRELAARALRSRWISPKERAHLVQTVPNVPATMSEPFTTAASATAPCTAHSHLPPGWFSLWLAGSRWVVSRGKQIPGKNVEFSISKDTWVLPSSAGEKSGAVSVSQDGAGSW